MTLLTHDEYRWLQAFELSKPCYRTVGPSTVLVQHEAARRQVAALTRGLHDLGFVRWSFEARRWHQLYADNINNFLCRWACAIKTHKKDGYVVAT